MLHHGKVAVVVCNGSSTAFRACVCHFRFGPISRHYVAGQHLPRWARKGHTHGDIEGDTLGHCFALSSIFQKADRVPVDAIDRLVPSERTEQRPPRRP